MGELPSREVFAELLKQHRISRRLVRDLRYIPEDVSCSDARDFLTVRTKAGQEGVLLYRDTLLPFTLSKRTANARGRVEAIICDICATWQRGTNSAVLTFKKDDKRTVSYLVCADLDCSLHVRDLTNAATLSRTQLREHISPEERVERLNERLQAILQF